MLENDGTASRSDMAKEIRRQNAMTLWLKGLRQEQIADRLQISQATVNRDIKAARKEFNRQKDQLGAAIFEQSQKLALGFDLILQTLWQVADEGCPQDKIRAVGLIKDVYLTQAAVISGDEAVSQWYRAQAELDKKKRDIEIMQQRLHNETAQHHDKADQVYNLET